MAGKFVVKRNGDIEPYTEEKVISSMNRVGVPGNLQPEVLSHIREKFKGEYITTDELFHHIFEFLEPRDKRATLRFNLRRAIFDLGPTGFPFEKYVARVFQSQGYKTAVGTVMDGECVRHEIDVLIEKEGKKSIVEAKFHNDGGVKTDVQVALYTYARFLDVRSKNNISEVWVITNTKLTSDAVSYAKCKGIHILAWNYPSGASLQDFVEKPRMYPITILTELTEEERRVLIEDNIILCSDLLALSSHEINNFPFVKRTHLKKAIESARTILEEV
jgi:hypothetical protein